MLLINKREQGQAILFGINWSYLRHRYIGAIIKLPIYIIPSEEWEDTDNRRTIKSKRLKYALLGLYIFFRYDGIDGANKLVPVVSVEYQPIGKIDIINDRKWGWKKGKR